MHDSSGTVTSFLEIYRLHHHPTHPQKQKEEYFNKTEQIFLNVFQLGLFEIYDFLYAKCQDTDHFKHWLIELKGQDFFNTASLQFYELQNSKNNYNKIDFVEVLTVEQHAFWEKHGYLKIEKLVPDEDCDAVSTLICNTLGVDLKNTSSWYPQHEKLQGLMLQLYQDKAIERIRNNKQVNEVFTSLYRNQNILPNTEKVSYNPPVSSQYAFKGSPLHWDIDFNIGPRYYIQGLLYLNDVPADRGAFTVIPGFHNQIKDFLQKHETAEMAIEVLRDSGLEQPVPGKKGDLILWLESLPHAASPNHSDLPRFVQYISFNPD